MCGHGRGSEALQPAKHGASSSNPDPLLPSEVLILSKPGRRKRRAKKRAFVRPCLSNGCANAFRGSHGNWQPLTTDPPTLSQKKKGRKLPFETIRGPQTGMLPRLDLQGAQGAFKDSMIHFCNSHYLSQFAAFFIDGRTKRSVAKSCFLVKKLNFFFHSTPRSSKVFWCKKC